MHFECNDLFAAMRIEIDDDSISRVSEDVVMMRLKVENSNGQTNRQT